MVMIRSGAGSTADDKPNAAAPAPPVTLSTQHAHKTHIYDERKEDKNWRERESVLYVLRGGVKPALVRCRPVASSVHVCVPTHTAPWTPPPHPHTSGPDWRVRGFRWNGGLVQKLASPNQPSPHS